MYSLGGYACIFLGCWLTWLGYWFANWHWSKEVKVQEPPKQGVLYLILLVVAFLLLASDTGHIALLHHHFWTKNVLLIWIGAVFVISGLACVIWARRSLADNWSAYTSLKKDHRLIQTGPYKIVRHPIYAGLLAMFVGTALAVGSVAAILSVLLAFWSFQIRIRLEEKLLITHFPHEYTRYKFKTKSMIPFIY